MPRRPAHGADSSDGAWELDAVADGLHPMEEEALVAVTSHEVEDASLIVVHVNRSTAPEQHEALGHQLRAVIDEAPEASVVIVHGNGAEETHEPTQAILDDVVRHGQRKGVVVHHR